MLTEKDIQKALKERIARAASRGFTREYQDEREHEDKYYMPPRASPSYTRQIRERSAQLDPVSYKICRFCVSCLTISRWKISRNQSTHGHFPKNDWSDSSEAFRRRLYRETQKDPLSEISLWQPDQFYFEVGAGYVSVSSGRSEARCSQCRISTSSFLIVSANALQVY